jgi:hypothetical protein
MQASFTVIRFDVKRVCIFLAPKKEEKNKSDTTTDSSPLANAIATCHVVGWCCARAVDGLTTSSLRPRSGSGLCICRRFGTSGCGGVFFSFAFLAESLVVLFVLLITQCGGLWLPLFNNRGGRNTLANKSVRVVTGRGGFGMLQEASDEMWEKTPILAGLFCIPTHVVVHFEL